MNKPEKTISKPGKQDETQDGLEETFDGVTSPSSDQVDHPSAVPSTGDGNVDQTINYTEPAERSRETFSNTNDQTIGLNPQTDSKSDAAQPPLDPTAISFRQTDGADDEATKIHGSKDEHAFSLVDSPVGKKTPNLVGQDVGDYEILSVLGRGGMGVVYQARDKKLNRLVALKMILSGSHASQDIVTRFVKEARAAATLQHPNIVQVFEIAEDKGLPYFSLEFVEGDSLSGLFKDEPAAPKQAAGIVLSLAEAMQYAHDHGILHRDLKPANVLMTPDGIPKITDFGLAKNIGEDDGQTKTGAILGTPGYMSPEQASGMAKELEATADQYSLGAVLYRLLAGRAPFVSSRAMDTIIQVIKCEPVPLQQLSTEVPADLETICLKTLSKDPKARYENCQAFADDLRRFINNEPIHARPISKVEKLVRWCKRNPKIAGLIATSFLLLATIAGVLAWSSAAIATQRDFAKSQEQLAKDNLVIANENEERANANAVLAKESEEKATASAVLAKESEKKATASAVLAKESEEKATASAVLAKESEEKATASAILAKENEEKAIANADLAKKNEKLAQDNEEIAKQQAVKIVKTMQQVLTEIDPPLRADPKFAQTRLDIMKSLSKTYNDLQLELHTDVKSETIPTFMAIRFNLVNIFTSLNEGELAHEEIVKLYELAKERVRLKDGVDAARSNLVRICQKHAAVTEKAKGIEASKPFLDEALAVARDIIKNPKPSEEEGTPPVYVLKYLLSNCLQSNGIYHYNRGELAKAAPFFKEAGEVRTEILKTIEADNEFKEKPEEYRKSFLSGLRIDARRSALGAATLLFKTDQMDEGAKQYQEVFALVEKEFENDPSMKNEIEVAKVGTNLGFNYFKAGQSDKATEVLKNAETITTKIAKRNGDDLDSQYSHSVTLYRYGIVLEAQGKAEAKSRFAKCVEIREKLAEKDANLKNETMLMVAYARNANTEKALEIADRLNGNKELEGKMRIDIARAYVQCSRFVDGDDEKALLVKKSLATIQEAIVGGYQDWYELQSEPDLGPLQEIEEFETTLANLKAKS